MKTKHVLIFSLIIVGAAITKNSWYQFSVNTQTEESKTRGALFRNENSPAPQAQLYNDDFDQYQTAVPLNKESE